VNNEYDIIWSSDDDLNRTNILANRQRAFSEMADQMNGWEQRTSRGGLYEFETSAGWNNRELIAFAPIDVGNQWLVVGVKTPEKVVKQTSFSNFQRQQIVFLVSILIILAGVLVGGFVLRRESRLRFQLEESLKQSEMEQAIMTERNRLAGDLHDSVTQGLYGIVLHADAAKGQLTAGKIDRATAYLEEIKAAGKDGLAEMRLLIFELRPPVLETEGLAAALETRLYAVEKRAGLQAEIQTEIDGRLPLEIEDGLYRIAQEALNNVLKHAHAQHIWVHLHQVGQVVTLEIKDDGRGFELESALNSGGMGLANMEERARKMGGRLVIESQPDEGTRTTVEVNL
jgi:signal transduction histidine kinase